MKTEIFWCDQCYRARKERRAMYRVSALDSEGNPILASESGDACIQHLPATIRKALAPPGVHHVHVEKAT